MYMHTLNFAKTTYEFASKQKNVFNNMILGNIFFFKCATNRVTKVECTRQR